MLSDPAASKGTSPYFSPSDSRIVALARSGAKAVKTFLALKAQLHVVLKSVTSTTSNKATVVTAKE